MKLVAVLGIEEHATQIKKIFMENGIPVFSEVEMKGYKMPEKQGESLQNQWFSGRNLPVFSTTYFAFVPENLADQLMEDLKEFNLQTPTSNPLHAFQLDVERMV